MATKRSPGIVLPAQTQAGPTALIILREPEPCVSCKSMHLMFVQTREGTTCISCAPDSAREPA